MSETSSTSSCSGSCAGAAGSCSSAGGACASAVEPSAGAGDECASAAGQAHSRLRIYQVFVNVEGLRLHGRRWLGFIRLPNRKRYGFYAVLLIAADEASKPPMLLALARETLVTEFASISPTPAPDWRTTMVEWRRVGAAPPFFQQPGCIDRDWGAAWYDSADEKTKQQRYRLTKLRLWNGKRAKPKPRAQPVAAQPSAA